MSMDLPLIPVTTAEYMALTDEQKNEEVIYAITDATPEEGGEVVVVQGDIPSGTIMAYYNTIDNIPEGWAICDGTNGTPNLIGKNIIGADKTGSLGETSSHIGATDEASAGVSYQNGELVLNNAIDVTCVALYYIMKL